MVSLSSKVEFPFELTRDISAKISDWGIFISTGTLLLFAGIFDKFTVKAASGMNYMYYIYIYLLFLSLIIISSIIFIVLRGYIYYYELNDTRLREITEIQERYVDETLLEPTDKKLLSPAERGYYTKIYKEYNKGYHEEALGKKEWNTTEWIDTLRDKSMIWAVNKFGGDSIHIWKAPLPCCMYVGAAFYIVGLSISIGYVFSFLLTYYDP